MSVEDQYRYMISGYFGVKEMDSYDLKVYILKEIENYIREFIRQNPSSNFDFLFEVEKIKSTVPIKTKLQDALLILNKMNAPMDLILQIKHKLKEK